eukprot:5757093-Alexandrium_andersonii.AAC.1
MAPLPEGISNAKFSVGVAFVVEQVCSDSMPDAVDKMHKYVDDVRAQIERKKIALPSYMAKFLDSVIAKAKAASEEA